MSKRTTKRGLSETQAAHYLGVARSTLRQARTSTEVDGRFPSPPFIRAGRKIIYLVDDLDCWLEAHRAGRVTGGGK
jgi:hypothetical protein